MKKCVFLMVMLCLLAFSAFADIAPNWNLDAPLALKSATITFYSLTTNAMEITTSASHNFYIGEYVRILTGNSFVDGSLYYTYQPITAVPTATTFRVAKTSNNIPVTAIAGTAYVDWLDTAFTNRSVAYNDMTGHLIIPRSAGSFVVGNAGMHLINWDGVTPVVPNELKMGADVTSKTLVANVATLRTLQPHGLAVNQIVLVNLIPPDPIFDGAKTVTAVLPNYFSYAKVNVNILPVATGGVLNIVADGTVGLTKVRAVCGSIFACSLTLNAKASLTDVFTIYRWDSESAVPKVIFRNNSLPTALPAFNVGPQFPVTTVAATRLGDTFDVVAQTPSSPTSVLEIYTAKAVQAASGVDRFYKFAYTNGNAAVTGITETMLIGGNSTGSNLPAGCIFVDGFGGDVYISGSQETAKWDNAGLTRSSTILNTANSAYQNSGVLISNNAGKLFKSGAERLFVYCDPAAIGYPDVNAYYNRIAIADVAAGMDKAKFLDAITFPAELKRANTNGTSDVAFDDPSRPRHFFALTTCQRLGSYTIPVFPTVPVTKRWTGAVNNDWFTAGNWSPASVPSTIDDVIMDHTAPCPAGPYTVQIAGVRQAVCRTLTIDGTNTNKITLLNSSAGQICGTPFQANGTGLSDISVSGNYTLPVTTRDESNKPRFVLMILKGIVPVNTKALTANVARISCAIAHNFEIGDSIAVALNPADAVFDGPQTVTAINNTLAPFWFEYAKVNANVAITPTEGNTKPTGAESFVWNNISSAASWAQGGVARVTKKALTTNVATITYSGTTVSPVAGNSVIVALNPADALFDGTYTITGGSATTITYAKVNANIPATECGGRIVNTTTRATWYEYDGNIKAVDAIPATPLGTLMTGGAQALDNGISVTFAATTGHNTGDYWFFNPKGAGNPLLISGDGTTADDLVVTRDGWIENRNSVRYTAIGSIINNWGGGNTGFIGPGGGYIHGTSLNYNQMMPSDQLDLGYNVAPNTRKLDGAVTWDPASYYVTDIFDGPANLPSLYRSYVYGNVICRNSWTAIRPNIPYVNTGNKTYLTCTDMICEAGTSFQAQTTLSTGIDYTITVKGNITNQGPGDLQLDSDGGGLKGLIFDGNSAISCTGGGTFTLPTGFTVNAAKSATFNVPFTLTKVGAVNGTLNLSAGNTFTVNGVTSGYGIVAKTGGTLNCAADTLPGTGNVDIQAGSTVKIKNALGVNGQFTMANTKTYSGGASYIFDGSVVQVTGASLPASVSATVKIDNASGVSLSGSLTAGTLDLTNGALITGANTVACANATRTAGFVTSELTKLAFGDVPSANFTWPIEATGYAPVELDITTSGTAMDIAVLTTALVDPNAPDPAKAINRTWTITPAGSPTFVGTLKLNYLHSDLGTAIEANIRAARWTGAVWDVKLAILPDTVNNVITIPGVSTFSTWTMFDPTPIASVSTPDGTAWGFQLVGAPGTTKRLVISNTGLDVLNISAITKVAGGHADFTIDTNPAPCAVNIGSNVEAVIKYSASVQGPVSATIRVSSDDPFGNRNTLFTGIGSKVSVSPNPCAFEFAKIVSAGGTGVNKDIVITNLASGDTTYTLQITAPEFTAVSPATVFVAQNTSATITVKYLPTAVVDNSSAFLLDSSNPGTCPDLPGVFTGRGWKIIEGKKLNITGAAGGTIQVGPGGTYTLSQLDIQAGAFTGSVTVTLQEPNDQHSKDNAVEVKFSVLTALSPAGTLDIEYLDADGDPPVSYLAVAKWGSWNIIGAGSLDTPGGGVKSVDIPSFGLSDIFATQNTATTVNDWMLINK